VRPFLVFRCSKCRNFTNAPVGQKRRRCSYCGKIIDIKKAATALFETPQEASAAVKAYNASRGGEEFEKAVERSRERIMELMPVDKLKADDITDADGEGHSDGKRKRLMSLLRREASLRPCPLDRFEEACENNGLDWTWVEQRLQNLANSGSVIFPRPWSIRLIGGEKKEQESQDKPRDVSSEILAILEKRGGRLSVSEVIAHFERTGVSRTSVLSSLERLMQRSDIYEPKQGDVSLL
jgi:hypothetical protein